MRRKETYQADDGDCDIQAAAIVSKVSRTERCFGWLWGILIVAATLGAYWPALHGEFVFDDSYWTTDVEKLLRDLGGLETIWTKATALQQYYPLTGTTFWLDYHLWHWWTLPYHLENVLLHASSALLVWKLLVKLEVPGAWLAGALFALHPMMAESTAWITERKNVLSMLLFLGSLLSYGRSTSFWKDEMIPGRRHAASYLLALALFLGALLSKITAVVLPPVLLLFCWWKRGRVRWKEDVQPTLPFFVLSLVLGLMVAWLEKHHVKASGADWNLSWPERILVAGRVPWFYLGKLFFPFHHSLIYPRWHLDPVSMWQWLFPLGSVAVLLWAWLLQTRIGRGPVTGLFYFALTLFPVLGLMNFYWMRFSFVGDHLAYLSSVGPLALGAAMLERAAGCLRRRALLRGAAVLMLTLLAWGTSREAVQYGNSELLWKRTLSTNPACWLAWANLGMALNQEGRVNEATICYLRALEIKPDCAEAHNNLGTVLFQSGEVDEAVAHYQRSLEIEPDHADAHNNLGVALVQRGKVDEAMAHYQAALQCNPHHADAQTNLGAVYLQRGMLDDSISLFQKALVDRPDHLDAHLNLGTVHLRKGMLDEAIFHYQMALEFEPSHVEAHNNIGVALIQVNRSDEARSHFQRVLELKPDHAEAHNNLGLMLLQGGELDAAISHFRKALQFKPHYLEAQNNLNLALARQK